MRIAIVGSRTGFIKEQVFTALKKLVNTDSIVITGGASGIDSFCGKAPEFVIDWNNKYWEIHCINRDCGIAGLEVHSFKRAVKIWNKRVKS